jgi:phage terminase large subunit-like protein
VTESLQGFTRFCRKLKIESGKPFRLLSFQRHLLADYFKGTRQTVAIVPKKNGKTTLVAALALYHLWNTENADGIVVAAARDQAAKILDQMRMFVRSSDELAGVLKVTQRTIAYPARNGKIEVRASDVDKVDGVLPTLAIIDELHRHRTAELYGVIADGLVARGGKMITISTAGWDMDSPLGRLRVKAHALPTFTRVGVYNHATGPGFVFHELCLEDGDSLEDLKLVALVNPLPQKRKALWEIKNAPDMTPGRWARFHCGIWTHGEEPWLTTTDWEACRADIGTLEEAESCYAAVVYGQGAAVALAAPRHDGEGAAVAAKIWPQEPPLADIERHILGLARRYDLAGVAFDKVFTRSAELLVQQGIPMEGVPLSPELLSVVTSSLRRIIDERKLVHDGDPMLRQHVLAGATKDTQRGWHLIPTPESRGLIAMAVAVHKATQVSTGPLVVAPAGVG